MSDGYTFRIFKYFSTLSEWINDTFQGPLQAIFHPTNVIFTPIPPIFWIIAAVCLFGAAMVWVGFILKKEYVNLDAPGDKPWHDLRLWTVVAMSPHVAIYIWFNL